MSKCILCQNKIPIFEGIMLNPLEGPICRCCCDHILALRVSSYGSPESTEHYNYLDNILHNDLSNKSFQFIINEIETHQKRVKTDSDLFVESVLASGVDPTFSSRYVLIDGIPQFVKGTNVTADLYYNCILFWKADTPHHLQSPVVLKTEQIISTEHLTEKEIVEKSKSVIGRSVVGGALLGPLGAVIGGMSGMGSSQTTKFKKYYTIHYTNSAGNEALITFSTDCRDCDSATFNHYLSSLIRERNATNFL